MKIELQILIRFLDFYIDDEKIFTYEKIRRCCRNMRNLLIRFLTINLLKKKFKIKKKNEIIKA